ncbi:histidine kinase [Micromonospora sp. NPDC049204]|uniref:sensor histidine kinase n=1 Tax=unclassified Micromonospora TaxID=2617518 RepID=UPI0033F5243D
MLTLASAVLAVVAAVLIVRGRFGGFAVAVAVTGSMTVTVAGRSPSGSPPAWGLSLLPLLAEFAALTVIVAWVTRRTGPRAAALGAGSAGVAVALLVLRLTGPPSLLAAVGACCLWGLPAVGAVAVGLHLRRQDRRRVQVAAEARRAQRLGLARDLHDYVAHDVSEMVAAAQAGMVVGGDPATATALFRRIEQAGQHAMAALDRTVHMLGDQLPGLDELPVLVAGFDAAGPVRADLDLDPVPAGLVPADVSALAYRTVAEALTNIRRHAPTATAVSVTVVRTDLGTLTVTVTNDVPTTAAAPARATPGGRGLPELTAAAAALHGRLDAGAHGGGWRLRAELPLAPGNGRP